MACIQAVRLYGPELWGDLNKSSSLEDLQLLLTGQARTTQGAMPTAPLGAIMRVSGLTAVQAVFGCRQQQFTARQANAGEGSKLKMMTQHPTSGVRISRVIDS